MKKLSKLKLHNVAILNDQEMKCITGGYDDVTYTYWYRCRCSKPGPYVLQYDAVDYVITSGKDANEAIDEAKSRCSQFTQIDCAFDKFTTK